MIKIISIIRSFLFGDIEEEITQTSVIREEIEENSQYMPPMDNTITSDESEHILTLQNYSFDVSNVEKNTQVSTLFESQSEIKGQNEQTQDDSFPLSYQLKDKDISATDSVLPQKAELTIPKVEKDTIETDVNSLGNKKILVEYFTELIKELDIILNKSKDENSRQTIKFCQSRIIEILLNNGVESMENDSIFDSTRHIPIPFRIVPNGTSITNVERIGLICAGKIILKAKVNI